MKYKLKTRLVTDITRLNNLCKRGLHGRDYCSQLDRVNYDPSPRTWSQVREHEGSGTQPSVNAKIIP